MTTTPSTTNEALIASLRDRLHAVPVSEFNYTAVIYTLVLRDELNEMLNRMEKLIEQNKEKDDEITMLKHELNMKDNGYFQQ